MPVKQLPIRAEPIAGNARKEFEERTGKPVISPKNAQDLLEDTSNELLESGD